MSLLDSARMSSTATRAALSPIRALRYDQSRVDLATSSHRPTT